MTTDASIEINANKEGRIRVLPPQEARRIAAGEVIDRPAALVREFLDNAIDSGAANIEVSIEGGGIKKTEVVDDGQGMNREDLDLCWLTHATSKITCLDDLLRSRTLGFRGEALAAAASVAALEIISSVDGREAWKLEVGPGENNPPSLSRGRRTKGSTVRACGLFDTIPARKHFLKREGSEAALCRQMFIDKTLVFPQLCFRFIQDGRSSYLPPAASKKERFGAALLKPGEISFLHEIHVQGAGFTVDIVIGGPELSRTDRRMLYIYANGRRIQDYALTQALVFGTQGWFPNGTVPIGAAFIDIDPSLADFNIHPAKREARFREPGAIHHAISSALHDLCHHFSVKAAIQENDYKRNLFTHQGQYHETGGDQARHVHAATGPGGLLALEALLENRPAFAPLPGHSPAPGETAERSPAYDEPRYAGSAFGLFILIELNSKLFIIDQHAAHERILYNRFISGTIPAQELLIPIPFATESDDDDRFLETQKEQLANLGIGITRDGNAWHIDALPAGWRMGDAETVREILELRASKENMAARWAATLCCHVAIRDGDYLDEKSALALAQEALQLKEPFCPHGRPIWTEISREALLKAVKRL
jgi:DNA mismatch repair protein MutL